MVPGSLMRLGVTALVFLTAVLPVHAQDSIGVEEARKIAAQAYVYTYAPLQPFFDKSYTLPDFERID